MSRKMSDYFKHKEYKLPNGRTVTAYFNELGVARITIQAMDALFNILNSSVEVVRCKDCKYYDNVLIDHCFLQGADGDDFCSYGERKDEGL